MENETTTTEAAATETPKPAEKGNGIPSPRESLAAAVKKLESGEVEETTDESAPVAPEKAEKAKRAAKQPEGDASLATGELEQLKALATKLGLALEDGKVTTTERVKLREERRANLAAIAQAEKDAIAKVQAARSDWEPKIKRAEDFEAAAKAGDYEAMAKLAGFKDWNELQDDQIKKHADPNYVKLREIETKLQQAERERAEREEEDKRQQLTRAEVEAQANHKRQLQSVMAQSPDPLVKGMHDMPNFINAVFNVQRRVWQESGGRDVLTAEAAIKWKPPEGGVSLYEELEAMHGRLAPAFTRAAPPPAGTPEKPKPKTATPPTPAASPRARPDFRPGRGFTQEQKDRMAAALQEDIRRERTGA